MKVLGIFFLLVLSIPAWSKTVARVLEVKGNAFSFTGKTSNTLNYGSKIEDLSEVMVEDGSMLSLVNTQGQIYHINGGSLVRLFKGMAELKNGNMWVVASRKSSGVLSTPNSVARFEEGQFVYSFDNITGKTQILVLLGDVILSNALETNLTTKVSSGYFSLVDPKYENGLPRTPTKVGLKSFTKVKEKFAAFDSIDKNKIQKMLWGQSESATPKRSIASVSEGNQDSIVPQNSYHGPGKIIKIKTIKSESGREIASVSPYSYYTEMKKKNAWKYKPVSNNKVAPIHYYGFFLPVVKKQPEVKMKMPAKKMANNAQVTNVKSPVNVVKKPSFDPVLNKPMPKREPASRKPAAIEKSSLIKELKASDFENSLKKGETKIKKHSPEVNTLIDELKSFKQDYKKSY